MMLRDHDRLSASPTTRSTDLTEARALRELAPGRAAAELQKLGRDGGDDIAHRPMGEVPHARSVPADLRRTVAIAAVRSLSAAAI